MKSSEIANMISWILFSLGIILLIWKLIGGSPAEFTIIMTFQLAIIFNLVQVNTKLARIEEKTRNLENKFGALASDFKEHIKHK